MNLKYMRTLKRQISLNAMKSSFDQTGYVDWHFNPRLSESQQNEDHEGDTAALGLISGGAQARDQGILGGELML